MKSAVLGVSAFFHDSAAAILVDGEIVAAAEEERFSRRKHDHRFPKEAIQYCLKEAGLRLESLEAVSFYEKPFLKFERLLETYLAFAPRGVLSFTTAMPAWLKDKLFLKETLKQELSKLSKLKKAKLPPILFAEHHQSHSASAFYPSPFESAAVLCLDGVGEWATTSVWQGKGNQLKPLWELDFPHSLGLLYSAFTYFTGFKVNSGEYKLMGLAPFGSPKYVQAIYDNLIDLKPDGTFRLNMDYFGFATGLTMTNSRFNRLFGGPPRSRDAKITQREMDLARSIQEVTEEVVLRLCRSVHKESGEENLCLAGGVALNSVANGRVLREGPYQNLWIQPAAGDAGGALGAAFSAWHEHFEMPRPVVNHSKSSGDLMKGAFLGPTFQGAEVTDRLDSLGARYQALDEASLLEKVADLLAEEKIVGWVSGRMEFGPRALGARSILGDPRSPKMQSKMNLKIKYRESFRPFAPAVLGEFVSEFFDLDSPSPYMGFVAPVAAGHRRNLSTEEASLKGFDSLLVPRSDIPAVTHVDCSARVQTVEMETNPRFYKLLEKFKEKTGCPVLINTSFNVRGEPIVCTPEDAYRCFMRTEIDYLVIDDYLLSKEEQPLKALSQRDLETTFAPD